MTTVLLMGPPGAGKGTHAGHLAGHLGVPVISTGDLFRRNIKDGTELGRTAQRYLDAGEYVPDEVTNAMVRDRLAAADARPGFVLDGYPRTLEQAGVLDDILGVQGRSLDAALVLQVEIGNRRPVPFRLAERIVDGERHPRGGRGQSGEPPGGRLAR